MEKYNKESPSTCPQCDAAGDVKYHSKGIHKHLPMGVDGGLQCPTELAHMHRTCLECGYEWAEEPIVAAQ